MAPQIVRYVLLDISVYFHHIPPNPAFWDLIVLADKLIAHNALWDIIVLVPPTRLFYLVLWVLTRSEVNTPALPARPAIIVHTWIFRWNFHAQMELTPLVVQQIVQIVLEVFNVIPQETQYQPVLLVIIPLMEIWIATLVLAVMPAHIKIFLW